MTTEKKQTLAILGPGRMGLSLAEWAMLRGFIVNLAGRDLEHAQRAAEGRPGLAGGIHLFGPPEEALLGADFVFEAIYEDLGQKADAWRVIQALAPEAALMMTGTSSIPLSSIRRAAGLSRPLVGFHLFMPISRMKAVEIVLESGAPDNVVERTKFFAAQLEKTAVFVQDGPGFAASRMALALGLEAMRLLESGAADAESLDSLMKLGYGHPVGPLELSDRVGLDLRLAIARQMHGETGLEAFRPPAILESKVAKGETGAAAGKGFFEWRGAGGAQR